MTEERVTELLTLNDMQKKYPEKYPAILKQYNVQRGYLLSVNQDTEINQDKKISISEIIGNFFKESAENLDKYAEEMDKLETYLKENDIPYERDYHFDGYILYVPSAKEPEWDAVCFTGSYGYKKGLLEVYGESLIDDSPDCIEGNLSANALKEKIEAKGITAETYGKKPESIEQTVKRMIEINDYADNALKKLPENEKKLEELNKSANAIFKEIEIFKAKMKSPGYKITEGDKKQLEKLIQKRDSLNKELKNVKGFLADLRNEAVSLKKEMLEIDVNLQTIAASGNAQRVDEVLSAAFAASKKGKEENIQNNKKEENDLEQP